MGDHGQAEARGLGDPDAAGNHGAKHELGEVLAKLALDVLGELRPLVVHGDHDAGQNQARVQLAPHQRQRVEELHQPLERQVLGLHRHDHAVGGHQRVHGHRAQRRRAVQQGDPEPLPDRARACRAGGARSPRSAAARPRRPPGRGSPARSTGCRGPPAAPPRRPSTRRSGSRRRRGAASRPRPRATVALHCASRSQSSTWAPAGRGAGGDVDGGRRLADPALLIRDRVDGAHRPATLPTAADGEPSATTQGPLLGHPRAAGKVVGGRPALAHHVQVAVAGARVGAHPSDLHRLHRQARAAARSSSASSSASRRPFQATRTPPSAQQRRRQLGQRREPADRAGGDRVVGLAPASRRRLGRPGLGALADDPRVGDPRSLDRLANELALAPDRLDQVDAARRAARPRAAGRESRRRRPRRRSAARRAAPRPRGRSASRRRGRATRAPGRARRSAPCGRRPAARGPSRSAARAWSDSWTAALGLGAQSLSSGATITQRSGSSPSLKVSTPGAILEVLVDDATLARGHRLELDLLARLQRPLGGAIGLALDRLLASLPVAGGVHDHPLSLLEPAERGPVAEQLHRVDRLAAAPDQQAHVLAVDAADDLLGVLVDLDLRLDVQRVDDPLEDRPHALGRLGRQAAVPVARHRASLLSRRRGSSVEADGFGREAPAVVEGRRPSSASQRIALSAGVSSCAAEAAGLSPPAPRPRSASAAAGSPA